MTQSQPATPNHTQTRGSRARCLSLTSGSRTAFSAFLNGLVEPYAQVSPVDFWMPNGFASPDEAKLGETTGFLDHKPRDEVTEWWLDVHLHSNTPNWDLASTCRIGNTKGLVLVEAKAHECELSTGGKTRPTTPNGWKNDARIRMAIEEANLGLEAASGLSGWSLSADSHYQISNRFAWAWKVASLGVPIVLVYLGFLNCLDMNYSGRLLLSTPQQWVDCVLRHSEGVVPSDAWDRKIDMGDASLIALIRSAEIDRCV